MFEISQLKEMKLPELQEIGKQLNISKYRSLKKLDLVYQILDKQAANPKAVKEVNKQEEKPETPKKEASPQEKKNYENHKSKEIKTKPRNIKKRSINKKATKTKIRIRIRIRIRTKIKTRITEITEIRTTETVTENPILSLMPL